MERSSHGVGPVAPVAYNVPAAPPVEHGERAYGSPADGGGNDARTTTSRGRPVSARWEAQLTELVTTRSRALVGYAYALCGDAREAEDLVQDALVKVFRRFRRPESASTVIYPLDGAAGATDGRPSTEAYVRRAILTLYLDQRRRRTTWARIEPRVATTDSVAGHASGVTARADVVAALRGLSPRQRSCVILRFYDDLTVAQIAAVLGTTDGTIKRYLSNAMHALRGVLEPEGELR